MALIIEGKTLVEGPLVSPKEWEMMRFVFMSIGVKFYAEERWGSVQLWIVKEDVEKARLVKVKEELELYWPPFALHPAKEWISL
jgi:hypothetical protein